jgi:pimeloyl-ACP methyl ester carboxylesterase
MTEGVGASIALELMEDLGGAGEVVHLAHANGFPPGSYRPFAEALRGYHVIGLPARPLWPGSQPESAPTWHTLAEDLVEELQALGLQGIVGVGHSMGGVYTMLAALRRPELFRALVLIDPVILPPGWLRTLKVMRWLGLEKRQPLVRVTLRRRRVWPSRQACFDSYREKPLFAHWPDRSLWAYVEAGTRACGDGQVELVYPPEWEAHIFATSPADVWRYVPQLRTRTLVIRGGHSETFRPEAQERMERLLPEVEYRVIAEAGHMVPMERPEATGAVVREFLDRRVV